MKNSAKIAKNCAASAKSWLLAPSNRSLIKESAPMPSALKMSVKITIFTIPKILSFMRELIIRRPKILIDFS